MKSTIAVIGLMLLMCFIEPVIAASTLQFTPTAQQVSPGSSVDVAITVSGLGNGGPPSLSVFDIDVLFDASILDFSTVAFGDPILGDQLDIYGLGSLTSVTDLGGSPVNLFELSLDLPWELDDTQSDSFTLATLTFEAMAIGTSSLDIAVNAFGDSWGDPLEVFVEEGLVSVIPAPGALFMASMGIVIVSRLRRRGWVF